MYLLKLLAELVVGCLLAVAGCLAVAMAVLSLQWMSLDTCKTGPLVSMLIGAPLGCVVGVVLVNRAVSKVTGWNIAGTALALVLAVIGVVAAIWLVVQFQGRFFVLAPVLPTGLAMFGYHLCLRRKNRMAAKGR
jgi:hypothetical protein